MDADVSADLAGLVKEAASAGRSLFIRGHGSKRFYGRPCETDAELDTRGHRGILSYDPSELVITVRGGTPLTEVEVALEEAGQMLPFEPPRFAAESTIGGAVAAGLSGPGRPWRGAVRDVLLGVRLLDGQGNIMSFGGQVMKNVAGYDLSRLMAGALGTLGVLLDVSVRLLPRPRAEKTLLLEREAEASRALMRALRAAPVPLSASSYTDGKLHLRLSGHESVLDAFRDAHGGAWVDDGEAYWRGLRDQTLPFFARPGRLWRVSVPPDTAPFPLEGEWLVDWGGAQHWVRTGEDADRVRRLASDAGGHAVAFRQDGDEPADDVFQPLNETIAGLHRRLKSVFDPKSVLNPGRVYGDW
jgi:glycolate oxidase FAD binding subunit